MLKLKPFRFKVSLALSDTE